MKYSFFIILCFSFLQPTYAKRFANQYVEFELPQSWDCVLEGAEWVCQSQNEKRKKEAIIIFAAKSRGPKDSLEEYQHYLKDQKTFTLPGGQSLVSEPKYTKLTEINGHRWIDALHLASEIPGFYTRYLGTVKEDIGVVITFSVSKESYALYQPVFDKIVSSVRVFRQAANAKVALNKGESGGDGVEGSVFVPDNPTDILPQRPKVKQKPKEKSAGGGEDMIFLIVIGVVVAVLFMIKKKK